MAEQQVRERLNSPEGRKRFEQFPDVREWLLGGPEPNIDRHDLREWEPIAWLLGHSDEVREQYRPLDPEVDALLGDISTSLEECSVELERAASIVSHYMSVVSAMVTRIENVRGTGDLARGFDPQPQGGASITSGN